MIELGGTYGTAFRFCPLEHAAGELAVCLRNIHLKLLSGFFLLNMYTNMYATALSKALCIGFYLFVGILAYVGEAGIRQSTIAN